MMFELMYDPKWFYGKDVLTDIVSLFILFFIGYFSLRSYNLKKNKNYLIFTASFWLMALSFFFKIITNFTLYHKTTHIKQIGMVTFTYTIFHHSELLFYFGFLLHRLLMLVGLYSLYCVYSRTKLNDYLLVIYLIIVSTLFTSSVYYLFHITSLTILILITYNYLDLHLKNNSKTSLLLFNSFILITISQILFIFVKLNSWFYIIAEILQTIGFVLLLVTFIKVLKNGKKKRKK